MTSNSILQQNHRLRKRQIAAYLQKALIGDHVPTAQQDEENQTAAHFKTTLLQ
jgi:hypothetical protein